MILLFYSYTSLSVQEWIGGIGDWNDPGNWDTGTVPGNGDDLYIYDGTVNVNGGAVSVYSITLEGSDFIFANNAAISAIASSILEITHAGTQSASGSGSIEIHGIIEKVNAGSITDMSIDFVHYGTAKGDGTITFGSLTNNGIVAPGMSVGELMFNNFNNTSATHEIEIESVGTGGVNYDLLNITDAGVFS
ncbi:MAG: hypothetical protein AAFZ15_32550 [Bacteroidota bacterium]